MNAKTTFAKLSVALSAAFVLALVIALLWQSNANAQGGKTFKGAKLQNNQLIPEPGHKLRQAGGKLVEVIKEETTTEGSGPTARRITKNTRVGGVNVECACGGEINKIYCTTIVTGSGAYCKKTDRCAGCDMVATSQP